MPEPEVQLPYTVVVEDNYDHFACVDSRHATEEAALQRCRQIVDEWLGKSYQLGESGLSLYGTYKIYGEDPYIEGSLRFSGWDYARLRSLVISADRKPPSADGEQRLTHEPLSHEPLSHAATEALVADCLATKPASGAYQDSLSVIGRHSTPEFSQALVIASSEAAHNYMAAFGEACPQWVKTLRPLHQMQLLNTSLSLAQPLCASVPEESLQAWVNQSIGDSSI